MATEYLNNKVFEESIKKFQKNKQDKQRYELMLEDLIIQNNKELVRQLQADYDIISKEFSDIKDKLAIAFYLLAENIIKYSKFTLIDAEDAVQDGVIICFERIDRFDPSKGKAFNYMTTCIINNYKQLYRTAKCFQDFKKKYQEHVYIKIESVLSQNQRHVKHVKDKFINKE